MRIEVLIDVKTILGEGPLWDVEEQRLYFIDSFGCNVFRCTADGREVRAWDVPAKIGSMALRKQGGAVLSLANGFHFLDFKTGETAAHRRSGSRQSLPTASMTARSTSAAASSPDRWTRWRTVPTARSIASTRIYRCTSSTTTSSSPTGHAGAPTGAIFYFADTWTGEIWAYDYDLDTGAVSNKRTFCKVDRSRGGAADGSTVDAEGCLWNALVYDGRIVRYTPDGKVERIIEMPVKKVTSVMFGGPNLDILYVTSMAKPPLPRFPGDGVLRGSLFAIYDLGIRGIPENRFAG